MIEIQLSIFIASRSKTASQECAIAGCRTMVHNGPGIVCISIHLQIKSTMMTKPKSVANSPLKEEENSIRCMHMAHTRGMHKLTEDTHCIRNIRSGVSKIDKLAHESRIGALINKCFSFVSPKSVIDLNWSRTRSGVCFPDILQQLHSILSLTNK